MSRNRLTWQNVQAPQMDTSGLAMAGQQITGSIDRFAKALTDRAAIQEKEFTNELAARAMLAGSPEERAAIAAQMNQAGFRGDRLAVAGALTEAEQRQLDIEGQRLRNTGYGQSNDLTAEQLLDARARSGPEGQAFAEATAIVSNPNATPEQRAAAQEMVARGRLAAEFAGEIADRNETAFGQRIDQSRLGLDKGRFRLDQQRNDRDQGRFDREEEQFLRNEELTALAANTAKELSSQLARDNPGLNPEDARIELSRLADNLPSEIQQAVVETGLSRYTNQTTPTSADRNSLLRVRGYEDYDSLNNLFSGNPEALRKGEGAVQAITNKQMSEDPYLRISRLAESDQYKEADAKSVEALLEERGIPGGAQTAKSLRSQGLSWPEVAAFVNETPLGDSPTDILTDFPNNLFLPGAVYRYATNENSRDRLVEESRKFRDYNVSGGAKTAEIELENRTQAIRIAQAQVQNLEQQISAIKASGGQVNPRLISQLVNAKADLQKGFNVHVRGQE